MRLKLDDIIIDSELYPRAGVLRANVLAIIHALETGQIVPPIVVGKRGHAYVLLDGRHRLEAHRTLGRRDAAAIVTTARPQDFYAEAVRLNATHGQRLTPDEKIAAAARLRGQGYSETAVARTVMMPINVLRKAVNGATREPVEDAKRAGTVAHPEEYLPSGHKDQVQTIAEALLLVSSKELELSNPRLCDLLLKLRMVLTSLKIPLPEHVAKLDDALRRV